MKKTCIPFPPISAIGMWISVNPMSWYSRFCRLTQSILPRPNFNRYTLRVKLNQKLIPRCNSCCSGTCHDIVLMCYADFHLVFIYHGISLFTRERWTYCFHRRSFHFPGICFESKKEISYCIKRIGAFNRNLPSLLLLVLGRNFSGLGNKGCINYFC